MLTALVDTKALWETVLAAAVAGVGVTFIFSVAILGVAKFGDLSRNGQTVGAVAFGTLAIVALLAFAAAIGFGIVVMTSK